MRFAYPPYGPESGLLFHSKVGYRYRRAINGNGGGAGKIAFGGAANVDIWKELNFL